MSVLIKIVKVLSSIGKCVMQYKQDDFKLTQSTHHLTYTSLYSERLITRYSYNDTAAIESVVQLS